MNISRGVSRKSKRSRRLVILLLMGVTYKLRRKRRPVCVRSWFVDFAAAVGSRRFFQRVVFFLPEPLDLYDDRRLWTRSIISLSRQFFFLTILYHFIVHMNMACDSLVYYPTRKSRILRSSENLRDDSEKSMNIGTEPRFEDLNVEIAKNAKFHLHTCHYYLPTRTFYTRSFTRIAN